MKCRANYDAFMEAALRGAPKGNQNAAKLGKTIPTNSSELISVGPRITDPRIDAMYAEAMKAKRDTRAKLAAKAGVSEHTEGK